MIAEVFDQFGGLDNPLQHKRDYQGRLPPRGKGRVTEKSGSACRQQAISRSALAGVNEA